MIRRRMYQSNLHDLFYSLIHGGLSALDKYIANGGSLKISGPGRKSLLIGAIEEGQESVFNRCLELGFDLETVDISGRTALHWAAREGLCDYVETLLACGVCVDKIDSEGNTALVLASQGDHLDVIQKLVETGSDVNIQNKDGYSALHYSTLKAKSDSLEFLLTSGSNTFLRTTSGESPISLALSNKDIESVKRILDYNEQSCEGSIYSPDLERAVNKKYFDAVQMLLSYGVDPFSSENKSLNLWTDILTTASSRRLRETLISEYGYFTSSGPENKLLAYIVKNHSFILYFRILKLMFIYGLQLTTPERTKSCKKGCLCKKVISDIIKNTGETPGRLQVLCRTRIRNCLALGVVKKVATLPLPSKMKRFLCMSSEFCLEKPLI